MTKSKFVIVLGLALIIGAFSYFRLFDSYELILLDLRFQARPLQKINPQIAIVEISNDTLANLGQWPLRRDYHATLIEVLSRCGVKAIVFDVLFSEPKDTDQLLAESARRAGNVYFPYALEIAQKQKGFWRAQGFAAPLLPALEQAAAGTGFANVLTDIDGKRRRIPLFIKHQDKLLPQLCLQAAADYLNVGLEEIKVRPAKSIQLGERLRIPIDQEGALLVNLAGGWRQTFAHYSYGDILISYAQQVTPTAELPPQLARLKDKICFVGLTATGTADINPTALEAKYPMVGLQANLFNSILNQNFLARAPRWLNLLLLYILCILNICLAIKTRPPLSILYRLGLLIVFILAGFLLFVLAGLWIDLFFPILTYLLVYLGSNLLRYIKELERRKLVEKELSIARDIQRSFLKDVPEKLSGMNIAVEMDTARHVGGDLYDFVQFPDGRVGLMVGDVSGKGVGAALFMAQVISQFRNLAPHCASASETLTRLNREISRSSKTGLFVTMAYLIYDPAQRNLTLASGGHLPPFVFRQSQHTDKIEVSEGIPLGLMEEANFSQTEFQLQPQELVLLYTDGITEARDKKEREFGEQGIIQTLQSGAQLSSRKAIQTLKGALQAFVGTAPQHDDITMMVLKAI